MNNPIYKNNVYLIEIFTRQLDEKNPSRKDALRARVSIKLICKLKLLFGISIYNRLY